MSEKPNGYGKLNVGGLSRPFHVGTQQGEVFATLPTRQREDGRPLSLQGYEEIFGAENLSLNKLSVGDVRDFVYSALVSGCLVDGIEVTFTPQIVSYWIDEADAEEIGKPLQELLAQITRRYARQIERLKNAGALTPTAAKGPTKKRNRAQP